MSAEQLKNAVREYANEEHAGWACAGTWVRKGNGQMVVVEELIAWPISDQPSASEPHQTSSSES